MLGFFYLPLPTLIHEIAFANVNEAAATLDRLAEVGFAYYDLDSEEVWIPEMPLMQIGMRLNPKDLLIKGLKNELEERRSSPFFNHFLDAYAERYQLQDVTRSVAPSKPLRSPSGSLSLSLSLSQKKETATTGTTKTVYDRTLAGNENNNLAKPLPTPSEALSGRDVARPVPNSNRNGHMRRNRPPAKTDAVWSAYCGAYRARYREAPVRNAKINGQLAQMLARIPADEAASIAIHYLKSSKQIYVQSGHNTDWLLRDCELLRTEWKTGMRVTVTAARVADQHDQRKSVVESVLAKAEEEQRRA